MPTNQTNLNLEAAGVGFRVCHSCKSAGSDPQCHSDFKFVWGVSWKSKKKLGGCFVSFREFGKFINHIICVLIVVLVLQFVSIDKKSIGFFVKKNQSWERLSYFWQFSWYAFVLFENKMKVSLNWLVIYMYVYGLSPTKWISLFYFSSNCTFLSRYIFMVKNSSKFKLFQCVTWNFNFK